MAAFQSLATEHPRRGFFKGSVDTHTHTKTHNFKAKHFHTFTQPLTHSPTHSLTDFNAVFVNDGGRFWAHGWLQTTELEQTFQTRPVTSKSAKY